MKKIYSYTIYGSITFAFLVLNFFLATNVFAASTIGTNLSTTGTFTVTPAADSATSVRFQNTAGTNLFIVDTTNFRVGIGAAPATIFEVQGTASASYLLASNTIQVGGFASVAYNRFGVSSETSHSDFITTTSDVLINGDFEVDGKGFFDGTASISSNVEFGGTASISGVLYLANGNIRPEASGDGTTAFIFQNAAGDSNILVIDTSNSRVGIGKTPGTTFDVSGSASVSSNFEVTGYASSSKAFVRTSFVAGSNVASSSTAYISEFVGTATVSILFQGTATDKGTCLQLQNVEGKPVFARVFGTTFTVNNESCRE